MALFGKSRYRLLASSVMVALEEENIVLLLIVCLLGWHL